MQQRSANRSKQRVPLNQSQRLVSIPTISSTSRKVERTHGQAPPGSLDLALASTYDHHANWGATRACIVRQKRSCSVDHAAQFRDKLFGPGTSDSEECVKSRGLYRDDSFHVNLAIPPYHSSNSRRGYGRSADGSFYSA